jgi:hypothetical protein
MYITKNVYGFTYYLRRELNGYSWQGLRNNGTWFSKEEAIAIKLKLGV